MPKGKSIGYIPNALDYSTADPKRKIKHIERDMGDLRSLGFAVERLDLRDYFGQKNKLKQKLDSLGGVWVSGGNTFVLRQAMKLSGFDDVLLKLNSRKDFLYAGYSAGVCVLAPSLEALQIVDNPKEMPYEGLEKVIFEGLGILDYIILPHYKSDHPESADIDKEVDYCKKHKIPFKTLSDGEVIIIE